MIANLIGWIIAGLVVGAIARLLVPGRQDMGVTMTIILGIVGAFMGGLMAAFIFGYPMDRPYYDNYATMWPGWLMSIVGAVLVLWIGVAATRSRV